MLQLEATSGRTALHKAAFWGHIDIIKFLCLECKINANLQDVYGDTALHDSAKFGHVEVSRLLITLGESASSMPLMQNLEIGQNRTSLSNHA